MLGLSPVPWGGFLVMGSPGRSGQCLEGLERSGHSLGCPGCLGHSLERF